jgi:hypothetical protein
MGAGNAYLWITNPTRSSLSVTARLSATITRFKSAEDVWGKLKIAIDGAK